MDKKLLRILSLYDEQMPSDAASPAADSLANPRPGSAYAPASSDGHATGLVEHRRLAEAKFVLDNRVNARPDASVIDSIVGEAMMARNATGGSTAGSGLRLIKGLSLSAIPMRFAAAASVVLVVVVIGLARIGRTPVGAGGDGRDVAKSEMETAGRDEAELDAKAAPSQEAFANAAPDAVGRMDNEVAARRAGVAGQADEPAFSQAAAPMAIASDSIPGWDDESKVRLLQRRIETLTRANADLGWDEPAVPLEQLVRVPAKPGVVQAGARGN